jgi:hypothetical protein
MTDNFALGVDEYHHGHFPNLIITYRVGITGVPSAIRDVQFFKWYFGGVLVPQAGKLPNVDSQQIYAVLVLVVELLQVGIST